MKQKFITTAILFLTATLSWGQEKYDKKFFIENKGQWHSDVLYLCRMGGLDAWITKKGVNYTFYKIEENKNAEFTRSAMPKEIENNHENQTILGHRVLFELENSNPEPAREGKFQQEGYYNYFIGNDESKHATYVGLYKEAIIKNVYEGIDIRYYFDKGYMRYDFVVQPYADASKIKFKLRGQHKAYTRGDNKLCFTTRFGEVEIADLKTYQNNTIVPSKFVKQDDVWAFALGEYDRSKPLVIDPLVYSTYLGGSAGGERGIDLVIDTNGNAYITGYTGSSDFDTTPGVFDLVQGNTEGFITKLNATGSTLVFSTYIGGSAIDRSIGIAIDASLNVYVTGIAGSADFPVSAGAFQPSKASTYDLFVSKVNSTGTVLVYSTYIGGNADEYGAKIVVDAVGEAYITGATRSTNYDVTVGAFQTTFGGIGLGSPPDAFITKVNATGTGLVYSTYLGGTTFDYGTSIAIDALGNAYVTGGTNSSNFDITAGSFQTTPSSTNYEGFITKIDPLGANLVYSTYFGGTSYDYVTDIAIDNAGNAYVTGACSSADFPVTTGAYQTSLAGFSLYDSFVSKLDPTGSMLVYSSYLGGTHNEFGSGITIDASQNVYILGTTSSSDFPVTPDGVQKIFGGGLHDIFVAKLDPSLNTLLYSTYLGGTSPEYSYGTESSSGGRVGGGIAADNTEHVYITGESVSIDYPVTTGSFQTTISAGPSIDAVVSKICTNIFLCPSLPVQNIMLKAQYNNAVQLYWQTNLKGVQSYTVEKRYNNSNSWQKIAYLGMSEYQYTDSQSLAVKSTVQYRIEAKNKDGRTVYSNIVSVYIPESGEIFTVYPNPSSGNITIEIFTDNQTIDITDVSGKILQSYTLPQGKNPVYLNLPSGIYLIRERKQGKTYKISIL